MSTHKPDPTSYVAERLNADPQREAVDSQRGYDWQRWLTLERWLELEGENDLWIEFGEDITVRTDDGITTIQAKDRSASISLGTVKVRNILSDAVLRDDSVQTMLWTTSGIATEIGKPFGVPGIVHWGKVQSGAADIASLRPYLEENLSEKAVAKIKAADNPSLLAMVRRFQFVTNELDILRLRRRVLGKLEARLQDRGIPNPSVMREAVGPALFEEVARVGVRESVRVRCLTRTDLDREILRIYQDATVAQHPTVVRQTHEVVLGAMREAITSLRDAGDLEIPIPSGTAAALERDLRARYEDRLARSMFEEVQQVDELSLLGEEILAGQVSTVSQELRQEILLRASRSSSIRRRIADAERFLNAASQLHGTHSLLPAQARLLVAKGEVDDAIIALTGQHEPEAFSTLLSILLVERGPEATVEQFGKHGSTAMLTGGGATILAHALLQLNDRKSGLAMLDQLPEPIVSASPMLRMRRALYRFASLFDDEAQAIVQMGIPLDARAGPNIAPDARRVPLDIAIADFHQVRLAAERLELPRSASIASAYETWAELLHPDRAVDARIRLRNDLSNLSSSGLVCVQFAFAFDDQFDPAALRDRLASAARVRELSDDEFRALVAIAVHESTAAEMVTFINDHRDRLHSDFGEPGTLQIEIQAVARSGDASGARKLLESGTGRLDSSALPFLEAVVASAEGQDPVAAYAQAYEQSPSNAGLRNLLVQLAGASRWPEFALRAEELFVRTQDITDLADAARAYLRLHDDERFLRVILSDSRLVDADPNFSKQLGWVHFRLGQLGEAKKVAGQKAAGERDLDLEAAIAIESGEWETLPAIAALHLEEGFSAEDTMRAARLVQIVGQGPLLELATRAVELAPDDPNILMLAYTLVLEEGLEDANPDYGRWMQRAVEKSGDKGPVRVVDINEIVSLGRAHAESNRNISDAVMEGDLPMLAAVHGFGGSQLQMTLGSMVANWHMRDRRNAVAVNLFSGRRYPMPLKAKVLGIDVTALMTLTWLDLLPTLEKAYTQVHIPAGVMMELFDGQRRIREAQKSRLRFARDLTKLVEDNAVKILVASHRADDLDRLVGSDLADLLRSAETTKGVVIRPSPVTRLGTFDQSADLSGRQGDLSDIDTLIDALVAEGKLDIEQEERARGQSKSRQDGWKRPAPLDLNAPLYLDDLAIVYLQQARILDAVVDTFSEVWIAERTALEAKTVVEQELANSELLEQLGSLRKFVSQGLRSGFIQSGRYKDGWDINDSERASALNMIADLGSIETVVFDDRAINKDTFAADEKGRRVPLATSLDIIEDLTSRGAISKAQRLQYRSRLRRSGAILIPLDADELRDAVRRGQNASSPEFKAIEQSIDFVRLVEALVFPGDIPWFAGAITAVKNAVHAVWGEGSSGQRCELLSNRLMALRLAPDDWQFGWRGNAPPDWVALVSVAFLAGLAFPTTIDDEEAKRAFDDWIEEAVLAAFRSNSPERYDQLVRYMIDLINNGSDRARL